MIWYHSTTEVFSYYCLSVSQALTIYSTAIICRSEVVPTIDKYFITSNNGFLLDATVTVSADCSRACNECFRLVCLNMA